jgi:hypothetical protein
MIDSACGQGHDAAVWILAVIGVALALFLLDGWLTMKLRRPPEDSPFKDTVDGRSLFENGGNAD